MRVSIVLPVYNEAHDLAECLQAIAIQTVRPYEVIVVDNNSTDETAVIARSFPFVRLLQEQHQGVVHARNAGFDAARGDIIGRIDADTRLSPSWVAQVTRMFAEQDIAAFSGSIYYYDTSARRLITWIDGYIRRWLAGKMPAACFLLGGNMAIRRDAWQAVRTTVCNRGGLHEDLDLAAHLAEYRLPVVYEAAVRAGVSGRRADTGFRDFLRYLHLSPRTYASHGLRECRYMYPVVVFVALNYCLLRALYRSYDVRSGFRLRNMFARRSAARINPAL